MWTRPKFSRCIPNADITYRTRQAQEALTTILDIQPRDAVVSGGVTREEKVLGMADGFLRQLPENWSVDRKLHIGDRQPLSIFAGQEIDRLSVTIRAIRQTCTNLKLAVAGTIILYASAAGCAGLPLCRACSTVMGGGWLAVAKHLPVVYRGPASPRAA
ncbi:putative dynein heavy chain [Trypanosoma cruzi]|uniref:Putative dynein heavy chain n=1 Tax=Trypanosoma cruzi TaxID=5693 RepID=A0A2V2WDA9_TRYCR|nr:putative dynein heavy chain [Trypanosoma cruzi]